MVDRLQSKAHFLKTPCLQGSVMASTKVPEAFAKVTTRTASALLPRFQTLLTQWEVDAERQKVAPNSPDIGVYLRQYVERSVKPERVSYEAAKAELEAAEKLISPDFFARYPNVTGTGLSQIDYEDIRAVNVDPDSSKAKKVMRNAMIADYIKERKDQFRSATYLVLALFIIQGTLALGNAIIKRRNLQS